jgi:rubrerythrin
MATIDNLKDAFAGESQANRKYLAFAKKADTEGFKQVARLFRAVAEAETIHAHSHLAVMKGVGKTAENLQAAIAGEQYEFKDMYPKFLETAEAEHNRPAVASFRNAMAVEEIHHELYSKALAAVKAGKDLEAGRVFVCPVCGHTVIGQAPDECPVCSADGEKFIEVK